MDDVENCNNAEEISSNIIDVVIVGAGFAGLYMLYRLHESGFSAKIIEIADGIGGVWYWNCYPGARCDIDAMQYSYSFSEELQQEWKWSEILPTQPEILRYLNYVADKFDLRKNIELGTQVNAAIFDETHSRWEIETSRGDRILAKFCVMATGCLSVPQIPRIKGLETFKGNHYHTGRWSQTGVNFSGRRVAVFGTGSSGVQVIPVIAEQAKHLFVFQRTATFTVPAQNKPLEPEYEQWWKSNYAEHRKQMLETIIGCLAPDIRNCSAMSVTSDERLQEYEKQWQKGRLNFLGAFNDLVLNQEANDTAAEFLRTKIREIVKDPAVVEKLLPYGFPLGAKRLCLDTDYFDTFNRDNVTLVDLRQESIDEITPTGIRIGDKKYELDDIVFATGFDAFTGALFKIDIRGRAGKTLREKWVGGPSTYLGLMTSDFPNLFIMTGLGNPTVFANAALCIEQNVDWIVNCLVYLRTNHHETIEPNAEAENDWGKYINAVANFTLFSKADSWFNGANIEGKPKVFMACACGVSNYRKKCQDIVVNGYQENNARTKSVVMAMNTSEYALEHRCIWSTCNVTGYPSTFLDYKLDCCTLPVPLNYARPDRLITISMSRLSPLRSTSDNNTLFILMGGPGGSGWSLVENVALLIPAQSGITLILPDHRGTGLSTVLGCDDNHSQTITTDCITYLTSKWTIEGLNQFTITAAAHDLSVQIQVYQADHPGRISIYSVSYGTLWLDRFLQIYPTLIQSAIMDGVVNPILISISRYDLFASQVGLQFLTYCQLQPECHSYFPVDQPPYVMLYRILAELDTNKQQCINKYFNEDKPKSDWLRNLFFNMIQSGDTYMDRTVIPAVIFRLNRCNVDDVNVLNFFFRSSFSKINQMQTKQNDPGFLFSNVLNYNIVLSEMWLALNESEVDKETIIAWYKSTLMAPNNAEQLISLRAQWPKYPLDQYYSKVASYTPLLMISGQLDPSTMFDQASQLASITSKTRTFYAIPLAGHITVNIAQVGYYCPLHLVCAWAFPAIFPSEWNDPQCIRYLPTTLDFL
ncbi:unnamed protein product [Rotaria sp. Silwood2]|nr:unnamed protein product [Rotaria sp. Silwood2]